MKRDYRSVIDHNNKTGNDIKTHPYQDEMNEIFGHKPTLKPVAVASSMVKNQMEKTQRKGLKQRIKKEKNQGKGKSVILKLLQIC